MVRFTVDSSVLCRGLKYSGGGVLERLYENERGGPVRLEGESSTCGVTVRLGVPDKEAGVLEFQESDARCAFAFALDEFEVEFECVRA